MFLCVSTLVYCLCCGECWNHASSFLLLHCFSAGVGWSQTHSLLLCPTDFSLLQRASDRPAICDYCHLESSFTYHKKPHLKSIKTSLLLQLLFYIWDFFSFCLKNLAGHLTTLEVTSWNPKGLFCLLHSKLGFWPSQYRFLTDQLFNLKPHVHQKMASIGQIFTYSYSDYEIRNPI